MKPSPSIVPGNTARTTRRTTTVYYDRGDIEVTTHHLAIGADRYPLRIVDDARIEHRRLPGATLVAAALGPGGVVVVILAHQGISAQLTAIALAATLGVTTIVALLTVLVWPRTYELWIDHEDVSTRVFSSTEEWRMRQLVRAILRALRDRDAPR
jgi:hypothetical protein